VLDSQVQDFLLSLALLPELLSRDFPLSQALLPLAADLPFPAEREHCRHRL
jgi:hypothetical protein